MVEIRSLATRICGEMEREEGRRREEEKMGFSCAGDEAEKKGRWIKGGLVSFLKLEEKASQCIVWKIGFFVDWKGHGWGWGLHESCSK